MNQLWPGFLCLISLISLTNGRLPDNVHYVPFDAPPGYVVKQFSQSQDQSPITNNREGKITSGSHTHHFTLTDNKIITSSSIAHLYGELITLNIESGEITKVQHILIHNPRNSNIFEEVLHGITIRLNISPGTKVTAIETLEKDRALFPKTCSFTLIPHFTEDDPFYIQTKHVAYSQEITIVSSSSINVNTDKTFPYTIKASCDGSVMFAHLIITAVPGATDAILQHHHPDRLPIAAAETPKKLVSNPRHRRDTRDSMIAVVNQNLPESSDLFSVASIPADPDERFVFAEDRDDDLLLDPMTGMISRGTTHQWNVSLDMEEFDVNITNINDIDCE